MSEHSNRASPEVVLGERLRQARELAGFTQGEAAQNLGITSAALSQYEAGKRRVEVLALDRIARLYNVPVNYFFARNISAESQPEETDWETELHTMARSLCSEGKAGIAELIQKIHYLENLYQLTETPFPGIPHHPFPAIQKNDFSDYEIADYARKVRYHYNLGTAPLLDVKGFLDAQGYQVFGISFGQSSLSGLYFLHPNIGPIIAFNQNQAYSRIPFTLSHEAAHGLFHWNRPAVLCRTTQDNDYLERFADRFASHFLIPQEGLQERLDALNIKTAKCPEDAVHVARYFGVSYEAAVRRLETDRKLGAPKEKFKGVKPVVLANQLGYSPLPYEFKSGSLPPENRFPRIFIELISRALLNRLLSPQEVAASLSISERELNERFEGEVAQDFEEAYA